VASACSTAARLAGIDGGQRRLERLRSGLPAARPARSLNANRALIEALLSRMVVCVSDHCPASCFAPHQRAQFDGFGFNRARRRRSIPFFARYKAVLLVPPPKTRSLLPHAAYDGGPGAPVQPPQGTVNAGRPGGFGRLFGRAWPPAFRTPSAAAVVQGLSELVRLGGRQEQVGTSAARFIRSPRNCEGSRSRAVWLCPRGEVPMAFLAGAAPSLS